MSSHCLQDADDLPFEKGEVLSLIRKDEEQWWTACNVHGQKGLVPVPYIERVIAFVQYDTIKYLYSAYSHRVSRALRRRELISNVQKGSF